MGGKAAGGAIADGGMGGKASVPSANIDGGMAARRLRSDRHMQRRGRRSCDERRKSNGSCSTAFPRAANPPMFPVRPPGGNRDACELHLQPAASGGDQGGVITFNCGNCQSPFRSLPRSTSPRPKTPSSTAAQDHPRRRQGVQILRFDSRISRSTPTAHASAHHAHQRKNHAHRGHSHRAGALFARVGRRRRRCPLHARRQPDGDRFDLHEQSGSPWAGHWRAHLCLGSKNGVLIVGSTFQQQRRQQRRRGRMPVR